MRPIASLALALSGLILFASGRAAADPADRKIAAAQAYEASLKSSDAKLKLRHNTERLIALWAEAVESAKGGDLLQALEGEARARALLAHWSGRGDDRARAEEAKARLERETKRGKERSAEVRAAPRAPSPKPARAERSERSERDKPIPAAVLAVSLEERDGAPALAVDARGPHAVSRSVIPAGEGKGARMVFDLSPAIADRALFGGRSLGRMGVERVRVSQFDEDTVRVVLDLQRGAEAPRSMAVVAPEARAEGTAEPDAAEPAPAEEEPAAATAEREPEAQGEARAEAEVPEEAPHPTDPKASLAEIKRAADRIIAGPESGGSTGDVLLEIVREMKRDAPAAAEEPEEQESPPPVEERVERGAVPDARLKRSTVEAVQPREESLLRIRRVVIDAGHGGKDFGAIGAGGVREKDVNLSIAQRLGAELKRRLGVQVVYTRSSDEFISLSRRARIANKSEADLFISVHANAHKKKSLHGIETYFLNTTSDRYAARLASRENGTSDFESEAEDAPEPGAAGEAEAALPGGDLGRDLKLLLADLAMRSASVESRRLAGYVQSNLVGSLRAKHDEVVDLGVKHALFYVLLGSRMPSVLVETGFVTHATEGRRLADGRYQADVASAIAQGVVRFAEERDAIARRVARASRPETGALVSVRGR